VQYAEYADGETNIFGSMHVEGLSDASIVNNSTRSETASAAVGAGAHDGNVYY